jgi:hypothetical protein
MYETLREGCTTVIQKFKDSQSLSKDTAKTLDEMEIGSSSFDMVYFRYLKSSWYVKKVSKKRYYLDENAWEHPMKTYLKKMSILFAIIFPSMLLLLGILVILKEFGLM